MNTRTARRRKTVLLLQRIKQINKVRLYRPTTGQPGAYPELTAALVYVNTLMPQDVLAEPEDRRGLTPLFWQHVLHSYGEVNGCGLLERPRLLEQRR